ncbi:hypothetical protein JMUB6875_03220 [Nocardia sp. JMUB6875]|uniref:hypothetical protein n=1 Tax=Nocardia sp. JMUB6875 TaxID=3158170 RepID=UPI0032E758CC
MTDHFAVFGYHVTGSTGGLFLHGIVVGGIGLAGLGMLLVGARHTARRGISARRELEAARLDPALNSRLPERPQPTTNRPADDTGSPADTPGNDAGPGADGRPTTRGPSSGDVPADRVPIGLPRDDRRR